MALLNYATKEITLKIVYYGPGLSGKTTNIEHLHSTLEPDRKGKLLSLSTEADRTLFFDFLPVEMGKIKDFSIRFQLYTVPGQVRYNATRRLVLKGADAVVFVADSQKDIRDANIESLENMRENLIANDLDPDDIPVVFQFNKRDLPNILTTDELNKSLNKTGSAYFEATAIKGKGVQETFRSITKQLLKHIAKKHKIDVRAKEELEPLQKKPAKPVPQPKQPTRKPPPPMEEKIIEEAPSLKELQQEASMTSFLQGKTSEATDTTIDKSDLELVGNQFDDTETENMPQEGEDTEVKFEDNSIESIYKAFMSEEEQQSPSSPAKEDIAPDIKSLKEPEIPIDEDMESLKAFQEDLKTSEPKTKPKTMKKTPPGKKDIFESIQEPKKPSPAAARGKQESPALQSVILDEINALSKTMRKINDSVSSLKSELNLLSGKIEGIETRFSTFGDQTDRIIDSMSEEGGNRPSLPDDIVKTINNLRITIEKAKKRKFWIFFS